MDRLARPPQVLLAGEATVFLARTGDPATPGPRTSVVTVEGPAVLALPSAPGGWQWVVGTGLHGQLADIATLTERVGAEAAIDLLRDGVRHTADAIGDLLRPSATPPAQRIVRLQPRPTYVAAGRAAVVESPTWVRTVEGSPTLLGAELPPDGAPLPARLALDGARFTMVATRPWDTLDLDTLVAGLAWLFERAAAEVLRAAAARHARDVDAARLLPATNEEAERRGVALLEAALIDERASIPSAITSSDPLIACAELVAAHDGLTITPPVGGLRGRDGTAAVRAVALSSGLFFRQVSLHGQWWVRSTAAVLGFRPEGRPVAILPDGDSMVVVDADGTRRRVRGDGSDDLLDTGFTFARPLDDVGDRPAAALLDVARRGRRRPLLAYLAWSAVVAALTMAVPFASGVVFGEIIPESDRPRLWALTAVLVTAALALLPLQIVASIARTRIEAPAQYDVQRRLWGRVLRSPPALVQRIGPGDVAMRFGMLEANRDTIDQVVLGQVWALLGGVLAALVLFNYDATLAVIAVGGGLVCLIASMLLTIRVAQEQRALDAATGAVNGFVLQVLAAIPKLRIAGAESRAFLAWAERFRGAVGQRLAKVNSSQALLAAMVPTIGALVLLGGAALVGPENIGVGTFMAFQVTYSLFLSGVSAAVAAASVTMQTRPSVDRAAELATFPIESSPERTDPGPLRGAVALRGVTFRYLPNTRPVLDDLSLRIEPSEMVAIAGRSGSGKSTILRVLLGFEQPEQGSVLYDDVDLTSLDVEAVRRQLGVVLQDGQLMPGTVRENLSGLATLSDDEAWELAEIVALADDIRAMPMGMDTVITLNGGAFSGGQRQRLLIGRALATKPRILLLDEATSALDNVTQRVITHNLAELGMTRLVIAHRLSTMIDADRIVVVDTGRVVESGTYSDLMEQHGAFHALATRQVLHDDGASALA